MAPWRILLNAFRKRDADECREVIEALQGWLAKDGFPPQIVGNSRLDEVIVRHVCADIATQDFMKGEPPP